MKITAVRALEVLDSRGNPTVQAEVLLSDGTRAAAQVPSGASTGRHEARELRDGDSGRYAGKGTLKAVHNVEFILGPAVVGLEAEDQSALDARLIETDNTSDKSWLGANAVLALSCAAARAGARARNLPLWKHLAGTRQASLPSPMVNIISGGLHAGKNLEFQDFLVMPRGAIPHKGGQGTAQAGYASVLEAIVRIYRRTGQLLSERGAILTGVADEGGWGPRLSSNEEAIAILREAIELTGSDMDVALDIAATHFAQSGAERMTGLLQEWIPRYGICSVEDPLAEDDWEGWKTMTARLGSSVQLIGDDLFATNPARLERGIREGVANCVLVKMNQIGTITETFAVLDRAREAGYAAVISARSGETEDPFLADLAVASGAGQIKVGSITRSERLSKYNRLLEIEKWEWPG